MDKKEVHKRVLKDGKPLPLKDFTWDSKTKTFSSHVDGLVLDFNDIHDVTFDTGSYCTFKTGSYCTFDTDSNCTFDTGYHCTFDTDYNCTFKTGSYCTFNTGSHCTFKTGCDCTFDTGGECTFDTDYNCTFKTGSYCTFDTGSDCTFKTGCDCTFDTGGECTFDTDYNCTFKTGWDCTFKTGSNCTIDTDYNCTFKTGRGCTFNTGWNCTFNTGSNCVIVRRDEFEVIQPKENELIQLCPYGIKGYLSNGLYNGKPHIIADGILSEVISQKGNVYKVINHNSDKQSFIVKQNDVYSHGETMKEARESLIYKLSDRDTSAYDDLKMNDVLTKDECIKMYMTITGACAEGTRYFVESQDNVKDKYSVKEITVLTKNQYGNEKLIEFMKGK